MGRQLLMLLAETPVHAGGSESVEVIDLPIQREAATGLPVIWGQSLKGALRQAWRDADRAGEKEVFGSPPPGSDPDDGAELSRGAVAVGDAQLVALPAATLHNVHAWVTSPLLLARLQRKLHLLGVDTGAELGPVLPGGYGVGGSGWAGRQVVGPFLTNVAQHASAARVGAVLAALACPAAEAFGFTRRKLVDDTLVVEHDVLGGLARMGTDVVARVQLDPEAKTAKNLFYSEYLPADAVLAAVLSGPDEHLAGLAELLDGRPLQLGGDESVGRGLLWCRVHDPRSARATLPDAAAEEPLPPAAPAAPAPPAATSPRPPDRATGTPPATGRPPGPRAVPGPGNRPSPGSMPGRRGG